MTRLEFHPEARTDFKAAAAHYAAVRPDLGQAFYRHIDQLLQEISRQPTLFRVFCAPDMRRHFRPRFPYAVVYVMRGDLVWVLAIMHFKQLPSYWTDRLANRQ